MACITLSSLFGIQLYATTFRTIGGCEKGYQGHGESFPVKVVPAPCGAVVIANDGTEIVPIFSTRPVYEKDGFIWWGSSVTLYREPVKAHMERAPL